ncbi:MAG TPA: hydantoinase/oxoprolinase family protein [Acidimicrobiales bacterium]|nr:hydantoinase/oxoprolinase family protein [Acidimicrobiales bacterium]
MQPGERWKVGVDTGGTFTDLVALGPSGEVRLVKVSSTPRAPADAVFAALERTGLALGTDLEQFVLGTTIATNAVLQRSGVRTLLLTTAGFEDLLYIQRIDRRGLYDLQWVKTAPLVPSHDTIGVAERILADGSVLHELTDAELERVVAAVGARLVEPEPARAVSICLLFSYVNDLHERRLAERLRQAFPGLAVSVSSEVAPIWREYERASTTTIDAFVKPIVTGFCESLAEGLERRAVGGWHGLMKSNGGQVPLARAAARPAELVLSGLAGGVIAGNHWCRRLGSDRAVTLDMGGTSADVGVIVDGQLMFSGLFEVEWGMPLCLPLIDVTTIGAGGSSIASIDRTGLVRVGPASAGADPGPACYGRGGQDPTMTDANLVLGRLDPGYFLGGELVLDEGRARSAIEPLADTLGLSVPEAADAIIAVAIENMAGAVRLVTVDRGLDYRDFDLVAFGGAGPLHAAELARRLGMRRVVVPPAPGLVSAFGAVIADARVDRRATLVRRLDRPEAKDVPVELARVAEQAAAELAAHGRATDEIALSTYVACRYLGQNYEQEIRMYHGHVDKTFELAIPIRPGSPSFVEELAARFHEQHERAYGYHLEDQPIQAIYLGATALVPGPSVTLRPYEGGARQPATQRRVLCGRGQWAQATVVRRAGLRPGTSLAGPAIVEEPDSTTYVPPGFLLEVDDSACLVLSERPDRS